MSDLSLAREILDDRSAVASGEANAVSHAARTAPHVVLYGLFGIGNTGNDATLDVAMAALRERIPGVRFTVVATHPEVIGSRVDAPCVPIRPAPRRRSRLPGPARRLLAEADRWAQVRDLLRTADCLLVPGTGILDDFGATVMGHAWPMWQWCAAARQLGVPVKFLSVGAGPAERPWSRRLFRWTAGMADHRSYRDEKSRVFANEVLKLDTSRDVVTPDLVFGLRLDQAPPPNEEIRTIGIGVIEYHNWLGVSDPANDAYEPYMQKLSDFCAGLLAHGKALRILTGDIGDRRAVEDLRQQLALKAPAHCHAVSVPEIHSLRELCAEIGKTDAVIATRFHTIVGALICGRPAVSIGYGSKNTAVMSEFGQGEYCQNIWDFDLETLRSHAAAITVNRSAIREQLLRVGARLRKQVHDHFDRIASEIVA